MTQRKSFTFQLIVMGGFLFFFYMFFALATSIYKDYQLEREIDAFQAQIDELAKMANEKPDYLKFLQSPEYKDFHAKESRNLINPGEKVIILPEEDQRVEQGPVELMTDALSPNSVLNLPHHKQWQEYFFGQTLSVEGGTTPSPSSERFFEQEAS